MPASRHRYLAAARLAGACAVGVVGQIAVDMPDGYFGARDRITSFGAVFAAALALTSLGAAIATMRSDTRLSGVLAPTLFSAGIGLFLPALASDPLVAGAVTLWNLVLLASHFLPVASRPSLTPRLASEIWLWTKGPAVRHLATLSIALTLVVVGYRTSDSVIAQLACWILGYGSIFTARGFYGSLRSGRRGVGYLVPALAVVSLLLIAVPAASLSLLALANAGLLVLLMVQQQTTAEVLHAFFDHPSRLVVVAFASAVLLGTVLLSFPAASATGQALAAVDAFFTATSATCVTGLIVLDTPHDFSLFGQIVILVLIQVGGLGIMTLSTFATLLLGGSLGLKGERALAEMMDLLTPTTALRLTRFIVVSTLAVEGTGAAALALGYASSGEGWVRAIWKGVFHSVSAFCNAGFALQSDSMMELQRRPFMLGVMAALIVLGGIGFVVMAAVGNRLRGGIRRPFSLQARVVLGATAVLIVAGTVLFAFCEWGGALAELPWGHKLANALFQSVTLRTAGFNSVEMPFLAPPTLLFMVLFMFVGASPGSTGGGIKTTTAVVLLAAVRATVRGEEPVRLFEYEVPRAIVVRSLSIVTIALAGILAGLFILLFFERQPFVDLLFEATSAFGTVGLSLGATPKLTLLGKLVVVGLMFAGRTGPLTLALLVGAEGSRTPAFRHPEARVMVG